MPVIQDGSDSGAAWGWRGDDLDTEIETLTYQGRTRYQWTVYDRAHLVKSGMARTKFGANIASTFAGWRYQQAR